jgi:hypothetical protein
MKYLWLLLPFVGMFLAAYIFGEMVKVGFQWWTIPIIVTVVIGWVILLVIGHTKAEID